jgi:hypothetical protein
MTWPDAEITRLKAMELCEGLVPARKLAAHPMDTDPCRRPP